MSQDLPIPRQENRTGDVMEWGDDPSTRPGSAARSLALLGRDRRLPPVLAGLGAVAAVGSLVGEWLVITIPNSGPEGTSMVRLPSGVADVGGFGPAYLVGLLGLAVALALALRGAAAVRHNARVAGLGLAAPVLAMLTAAAVSLDDTGQRALFLPAEGLRIDYGRGLTAAFVATALLAVALYLAGRVAETPDRGAVPGDGPPPAERGRGRGRHWPVEDELPPPADLTVEPTVPFARPEPPR